MRYGREAEKSQWDAKQKFDGIQMDRVYEGGL